MEDLHKAPLLYSEKIKVDLNLISFKEHRISFSSILLEKANINLRIYKGEEDLNLQFLLDHFSSKDTVSTSLPWDIDFSSVELINSTFSYKDQNIAYQETGINYWDLKAENIYVKLANIKLRGDTIQADIQKIKLFEKSGFTLSDFSAQASVSSSELILKDLVIQTPQSKIQTNLTYNYENWKDWRAFISNMRMKYDFKPSSLNFSDVAYFVPYLNGVNKKVHIAGKLRGTVDHLKGRGLNISLGQATMFKGDVNITGLPEIDETYWHLSIEKLITSKKDMDDIPVPPFNKNIRLKTPDNLNLLGLVRFKGDFSGFFNDFVAYGDFTTDLGILSSDISLHYDSLTERTFYKGSLSTQRFDFGKFFEIQEVGTASLSANVKGSGFTKDEIKASLEGHLKSIEINRYHYKNIDIKGNLANRLFNGSLLVNDNNLQMSFDGSVDFTGDLPEFLFTTDIRSAQLANLKMVERDSSSSLSTRINFNLKGNSLDNMLGSVDINNTYYTEKKNSYYINKIELVSRKNNETKELSLNSDLIEASITGKFSIEYLSSSLVTIFENIISANKQTVKRGTPSDKIQDFVYDINLKNVQPLTELFIPELKVDKNTRLSGNFNSLNNSLKLKGNSTMISINGIEMKHFFIHSVIENDLVELNLGSTEVLFNDSIKLKNFIVDTRTQNELMNYVIKWDNKNIIKNKANITGTVLFTTLSQFQIKINPSQVHISDTLWTASAENYIYVDSSNIKVNNILFTTGLQEINLKGTIAKDPDAKLEIAFKGFNLANLNVISERSGIKFGGFTNGNAFVSDIYNDVRFSSNLVFTKLALNNENIGDGSISSSWNKQKQAISLDGRFLRGNIPTVQFSGNYFPLKEKENIDLIIKLEKLQLQIIDQFLKEWVSDLRGLATGEVSMKGEIDNPKFNGKITLQKAGFLVKFLNTHYTFSNDVYVESNRIYFENVSLFDSKGNKAIAKGALNHKDFSDLNFDIHIEPQNFMCLNTQEFHNPLYYGTAFISGKVDIKGPADNLAIDITAKSQKGTVFSIPLTSAEDITESNFITFINKDTSSVKIRDEYKVDLTGIRMKFELDLTPDAEVQLIFDPKIGDVMKGKGNGHLSMEINTLGNFSTHGEFVIEEGEYLFTLMNVINKRFKVEKGGTIKWTGDPYNAQIDINAIYKLRTSLYDLGMGIDTTKKRVPVNVMLKMRDDLLTPDIHFEINLPGADEITMTEFRALLANEQELNRQVFALLTINRFFPTLNVSSGNSEYSQGLTTNSLELLSNQLSNWLSQYSNEFDIGVNYRPGDEISSQEFELALSTQLLNDRVIVDGNVGMTNNQQAVAAQNNSNMIGEFNIEYKISEDGKFRVKGFNRPNGANQLYVNSLHTQGVGLFYRVEFNSFEELFLRYLSKLKRKEKEKKDAEAAENL